MVVGGDDGASVGASEGLLDGASVEAAVGRYVGAPVGTVDGESVGISFEGTLVWVLVGNCFGLIVGKSDSDPFFLRVGFADGCVGEFVEGSFVGGPVGF